MKIYKKLMEMGQNFSIGDIVVTKLYLLAVAALLALIFPVLLSINVRVYVALFAVFYAYTMNTTLKKEGNYIKKLMKGDWSMKLFKKYSMMDFAAFKMTMVLAGLLIIKLFPVILTINVAWFVGVFTFGLGYFMATLCIKK